MEKPPEPLPPPPEKPEKTEGVQQTNAPKKEPEPQGTTNQRLNSKSRVCYCKRDKAIAQATIKGKRFAIVHTKNGGRPHAKGLAESRTSKTWATSFYANHDERSTTTKGTRVWS